MRKPLVLIKGGGDLASGVAHGLVVRGMGVVMTERRRPTMVRRLVSFGNAVYEREVEVEGVKGVLCASAKEAFIAVHSGKVAVVVDPACSGLEFFRPAVLVDARLAKNSKGTRMHHAPVVIGVGPGFTAGKDCHAVVESLRGPDLGVVLLEGSAAPDTGRPAEVEGYREERVLRAPGAGIFESSLNIGDDVKAGVKIGEVRGGAQSKKSGEAGAPGQVTSRISGVLRGLIHDGVEVSANQKIGDVDPSGVRKNCFVISDRALIVGDGVLSAIRKLAPEVLENAWPTPRRAANVQGGGIEHLRRRWSRVS